ncbi:LysR family transcriptional regulator substrate-binding protein [Pseudocitrobacter sp. 73]|uniref:LysR family transcriptional regulator substrate-binding protein n=1 Tax=Pseudocitrobacter sp. 73 TaxID=2605731 RepID=UPI0021030B96|nr:LysR family transcriptional regulator substrate-binding protein [Pseudocitrobacter sp. 73]
MSLYQYQTRDNISLGVSGSHLVLPIFKQFSAKYPEIALTVKEFSTEQTIKKIGDKVIDFGIVYQCRVPENISATRLFEDEIVAAVPLSHPLARQTSLHLEQLAGQPIIILNESLLLRGVIATELGKRHIAPNIICELDNHYSCLEYAEAQIGIALLTRSLLRSTPAKNVRLMSLQEPTFYQQVILVHSSDLLPDEPVRDLLTQIKDHYGNDTNTPEKVWSAQKMRV